MANDKFPKSGLPIRKTVDLLPATFRSESNDKFMSAVVDPLVQPGVLEKIVGYVGRRFGKTYGGTDVYLDSDETLRSRYQLEPGVVIKDNNGNVEKFYDYIDFKNQLKFFGNNVERDDLTTAQEHFAWNPPKHCDKYVNFLECYWIPEGPPPVDVFGQSDKIVTQYQVTLGATGNSYIFSPNYTNASYINNPTLTFYRGATYKFRVICPQEGFVIRSNYDTGSLLLNPNRAYQPGELAVYDNKLWKAKVFVAPGDGSSIDADSQDWEFVEIATSTSVLDYNDGVTNNGVENGFMDFTVPYNAPDVLYYQSKVTPDRFGRIIIADIEANTFVDVEKEIIGKATYTSGNGVKFTTGLIVEFKGNVTPAKYAKGRYVIENVGAKINVVNWDDLVIPRLSKVVPEVTFDDGGFDTGPFDDATAYPSEKDYLVISRDSIDLNPWTRYNRWFHRAVLDYAYGLRGQEFTAPEEARAKRPIYEFLPGIQLFNHGRIAKETVDYIDTYTDDILSKIEGSAGYSVDGEELFEGARLLVVADTDDLTNNKIYEIQFIVHNGKNQIHLAETEDTVSKEGECVLIRRGTNNQGLMFHFNGTAWVKSQEKTKVNQPPLFDVYDEDEVSFSDTTKYPDSTFAGSEIVGYKVNPNGIPDPELGIKLTFLNIDNIGDVVQHFNWDTDTFTYRDGNNVITKRIAIGYYYLDPTGGYGGWGNGWTPLSSKYTMPILDSVKITSTTNTFTIDTVDWTLLPNDDEFAIRFYVNGGIYKGPYVRTRGTFTFTERTFKENDIITVKVVANVEPKSGYYQIPLGLEKNPLNAPVAQWTLGQAADHLNSGLDFNTLWSGVVPGLNDLRDIPFDEFGQPWNTYSTRYLHHSGITPLAIALLCDKTTNIVKALQYSKKSYTDFKNNFVAKAIELPYNENIPNFVDDIISNLSRTKNINSPFADSDMVGSGAYTSINYTVEDTGIKIFALSTRFVLTELSRRAVYVYINGTQLLHGKDYEFNGTFGFVTILKSLNENDLVDIREYVSTASCNIPSTPSTLGLYKKYTPMKFVDDTYREPKEVIQGHDGSITIAYGDFRDDLLLELEYRIYNNIKTEYNAKVFDIDATIGGYYGNALFNREELNDVINPEFLKWVQNTNINYTLNEYFIEYEPFTYTYTNMSDPTGTQNLPGWWRGVYKWFYDTDRPHRCPWEMLGFSEQPTWWEAQYGAAPYTSNNLILWEDLRDGVIRQGTRAGRYDRYKRSSLMSHLPVDGDGKLLSPLDSGLARDFVLLNNRGSFTLGDVSPVEYAWRSSSEWPFAIAIAMCLLKPFDFIANSFDRSTTRKNKLNQTINKTTGTFVTLEDLIVPETAGTQAAGLVNYLVSYVKSKNLSLDILSNNIKNLSVQMSTRLSGFVDKEQQKYLLDTKSPQSATSGIFIPPENYDIVFNVSSPVKILTYSGVLLEKTEGGWILNGYDDVLPYFGYYEPLVSQGDPLISVGGVSENFVNWESDYRYSNGQIVLYKNDFYRANITHESATEFVLANWKKLPKLPVTGAVEALKRREFNKIRIKKLSYGSKLTTIQQVVDFLLGYEEYLKDQGFIFDNYDTENQVSQDWTTSCKEFMYWTKHNWAIGSIIALSPAAEKINASVTVGVAENIIDGFYDYQVLKDDGKPLSIANINVNRTFQNITIQTTNTEEGIYFIKLYYVLKEHITVFDDITVFNDVIYDKPTGYRQDRIKSVGFRTTDWDGDYTSPGFLFDNVNIQVWQPFTDYRLGDIVSYRSYNWTSLQNQLGTQEFDDTKWTKLDSTPSKRLVPNFDYRINLVEDYYDITSDGIGVTTTALSRHATGYQARPYLENLSEDAVTQYQLYQGFVREKGTNNAITKVFNKLSRAGDAAIVLKEEWAFQVGRLGGVDQLREIEFTVEKDQFQLNPQPVLISTTISNVVSDQYYRINEAGFTIKPIPYDVDINPTSVDAEPSKTAGYVKLDQVEFIVKTRDDILNLDISKFYENDHVWITFDSFTWNVLRLNESPVLSIVSLARSGTEVVITLNRRHDLVVDDIIGIKNVLNLTGFFKITAAGLETVTVEIESTTQDPQLDDSTVTNIHLFTATRFASYDALDPQESALLPNGSRMYIDNNGSDLWEVIKKKKQYSGKNIVEYGTSAPLYTGTKVVYNDKLKQALVGIPGSGYVMAYLEVTAGLSLRQIIAPEPGLESTVIGSFGSAIAISPDSRFLIVGAPGASGVKSDYQGDYSPIRSYLVGDVVLYAGKLWKAVKDTVGDGSTVNVYTEDWEPAVSIPAYSSGRSVGETSQGMISIYEWSNQQWEIKNSFVSPRPHNSEQFGSDITIGVNGTTYYMAVSAKGSLENRGRVYLYVYDGTEWKHLENQNYRGVYAPVGTYNPVTGTYSPSGTTYYPQGSVVWWDSALWEAQADNFADGSTLSIDSVDWKKLDPISTQCSLPQNISLNDDGSTLAMGLLSPTQLAELIKQGDEFGHSLTMSRDGSILVVGSPNSDSQYFAKYRGIWRPDIEYVEGDVVRYVDPSYVTPGFDSQEDRMYSYYRLDQRFGEPTDSTTRSYNELPDAGIPWINIGDSSSLPSGKIYIYQRSTYGIYELKQTINADSLPEVNDLDSGNTVINSGDQFGWSLDIDSSGVTLVVSSPQSDINLQNQGSAYIFRTDGFADPQYRLKQKLESFERFPNEYFGQSVSISANAEKIVIGAKNSPFVYLTRFDTVLGTTFDQGKTRFSEIKGYAGGVYVFENKNDTYFLTEKLETELSPYESFGYSVDATTSVILVGSPDYQEPVLVDAAFSFTGPKVGMARLFKKDTALESWEVLAKRLPVVDISKIKSIAMYDDVNNVKIQDLDYVDHAKLKVLNSAEQELKFKTPYDPAVYSIGTDESIVDSTQAWKEPHVGELWWDISKAKWLYYEQGDVSYRTGNWNTLSEGASIDVYEWVESVLLPSEWSAVADTNEGVAEGISGQPLYPNNDVYAIKELYNESTGQLSGTLYYYWVKNKTTVPENKIGRRISAASVASYINNPGGTGIAFISIIDADKFLFHNVHSILSVDAASINIQYTKNDIKLNPIHNEYLLLTEGVADSLPNEKLEAKWIDSLVGQDLAGNRVPDPKLPAKQKYGLEIRPRQSMFIDRLPILETVVTNINTVLSKEAFSDTIDFNNLNLVDEIPNELLNLYDVTVDTYEDLVVIGTTRIKQAVLSVNIIDGEIDTIDVISAGFGYKVPPPVEFEGDGIDATATAELDNQGRITSVTVNTRGKKYTTAIAKIRNFSVLIKTDSTARDFWSIYAWDDIRQVFFRSQSQAYDTRRYWSLIDWWKEGYSPISRITKEIGIVSEEQEPTLGIEVGDLIRVKEYAGGGWAVFEKLDAPSTSGFAENWLQVGRQNGTVEISEDLYKINNVGIGFDNTLSFDTALYDIENSLELRNILKAVKEDLFIGDYRVEWNKLFFSCVRYSFAEQQYINWAFKTSFLNATHNVGALEQKLSYKNDNLESFKDYINEVKPYRTTVREYVSRYDTLENTPTVMSDFDSPAYFSVSEGKIVPVTTSNEQIKSYPWKWWLDYQGYSIVSIEVTNQGAGYTSAPTVYIEGNGFGATARAYISNGKVSGVEMLTTGSGYTILPTISLVGGNASNSDRAKAVAVLGESKIRTFNLSMKFDRVAKTGFYTEFTQTETITAPGSQAVFNLTYPPSRDKTKISILKNGLLLLGNEYTVSLYTSLSDAYSVLRGKIIFTTPPIKGDVININYEKNDELLDSVNRIEKYYAPTSGMKGKDLGQLMTGIDFGGVQIQGTTFDVTGGWDALPWFTDNWDSVESSADYYHVCDGSTTDVTLPFTPANGQQITIYLKRAGTAIFPSIDDLQYSAATPEPTTVRIDDPFYDAIDDSSTSVNPTSQMPTFIGDGVNRDVAIGEYIQTNPGDILIFRPIESDGSVTITDNNLLDTKISGGSLASMSGAYATANGTTAEEIAIDGDKFISPDQVPAPEENIPGQVLDSLSIRVFNNTRSGAAPLQSRLLFGDGTTRFFDIGLDVLENNSVIVYVDKIKQMPATDDSVMNYGIDLVTKQIEFVEPPADGAMIEILAIGIGGISLLDYQEFVADGTTKLFLTSANYYDTTSIFVTVNGEIVDVDFINSTGIVDATDKVLVRFPSDLAFRDIVKIICLGSSLDVDSTGLSIVRVNNQTFEFEGSTRTFTLDNFVSLSRGADAASMIVDVNGHILQGVDTTYAIYDGVTNQFELGIDPAESAGAILNTNVRVFVNDIQKTIIQDYSYDGTTKILTIKSSVLTTGDKVKIENDLRAEYRIIGNDLVIDSSVTLSSTNETDNELINVTWFSEYPSMNIVTDEYAGGKINYNFSQLPLDANYVWIYKNGVRLVKDIDYTVSLPRGVFYLTDLTTDADVIKAVVFGTGIWKEPSAYEIHKDMLNVYQFKRYALGEVSLSKNLAYYDTTMTVSDATLLADPVTSRNVPGIVEINGERIEYLAKNGNVLSQLRRGTYGTSIAELHQSGSYVVDVSVTQSIPYAENQERVDFVSDGSTLLIGPIGFVPAKSTRKSVWYRSSIPTTNGPCDQIEVFSGGTRLRKDPITVYDEQLGVASPGADKQLEAEFSVDGTTAYIRLTSVIPAGTRISIIKRTGKSWYDRGDTTTTSGVTLFDNTSAIAKFIAARTTKLPE